MVDVRNDKSRLRRSVTATAWFVTLLWTIWWVDYAFHLKLLKFGVYPREVEGLIGVLAGPLIHSSFEHVFSNAVPLFVLGIAFLYAYPRSARIAVPVIWLGSGLGVWLFARSSYHIGASGLNYGMMFFLFIMGILRRDRLAATIAISVFFLYGGMVWGLMPTKPRVSFESHIFGAIMGMGCAIALRARDPSPPEKRYDWEDEAEDAVDPVIGDEWRSENDR